MDFLHQIPRIHDGLIYLLKYDPIFSVLDIKPDRDFFSPYMGPGFEGLARIVIGQQVSAQAATALWQRFKEGLPCVTPNAVLTLKDEEMRLLGLSHQKASYIRGLAKAVQNGDFDPAAMERMSDADVTATITALHGFGGWSAQMYLMFGLARPDVWPAGDLGIQEGMRRYLGLEERPEESTVLYEGERFAPHRTAASLLLWHIKGIDFVSDAR